MAMLHGRGGKVVWSAISDVVQRVRSWGLDATCDVAEKTVMGNPAVEANLWKTRLAGFKDWTATVECLAGDDGSDLQFTNSDLGFVDSDGNGVSLQLWYTHTATDGVLLGTGILTGVSWSEDKDDVVGVSYTFSGSGAIKMSDATT